MEGGTSSFRRAWERDLGDCSATASATCPDRTGLDCDGAWVLFLSCVGAGVRVLR